MFETDQRPPTQESETMAMGSSTPEQRAETVDHGTEEQVREFLKAQVGQTLGAELHNFTSGIEGVRIPAKTKIGTVNSELERILGLDVGHLKSVEIDELTFTPEQIDAVLAIRDRELVKQQPGVEQQAA